MAELKVTSGKAWRTKGEIVKLPSGNIARLKKPDPMSLLAPDGDMPDSLIGFMMSNEDGMDQRPFAEVLPDLLPLLTRIVKAVFIEPRVVDEPTADDEIHANDVSLPDKLWIFSDWLMGDMAAQAGTFPAQQSRDVDAVSNLDPVHTASE